MTAPEARSLSPPNDRPLALLLILGSVLAFATGTQYVAWRLGFPVQLGAPLYVVPPRTMVLLRTAAVLFAGSALSLLCVPRVRWLSLPLAISALGLAFGSTGRVYAPHLIVVWQTKYARVDAFASIFRVGWTLVAATAIGIGILLTTAWRRRHQRVTSDSHGTAHWGSGDVLRRERGLLLGREGAQLLRFEGEGHVLTVAPTRSGKGVSCVIPNLLDHPGSVLVTDPKGENYAVTARWRLEMGQAVHAFDPFHVADGKATYNPLDLIDAASPGAIDDARMLADMIVLPEARGGDQFFWNEEARALLTGLILQVAANAPPESRSLAYVRELLTLEPKPFAVLLEAMQASPTAGGLVSRSAARILQKAERERSGVISTAQSHTHFLDSPQMSGVMARSTVDLSTLKTEATSVYLILPSDRLEAYARWLRLMISSALLAMARTRGQPKERVLFLLDEFAHLGKMHPVQRDIGLAGGFGVAFWLIVQDLSQLRSTYGETWPTFLANAHVLQAFGTNDWDTAEYLSKMTGDATILVESESESRGVSRGRQSQRQQGTSLMRAEKGRRLLLPDEMRRLPSSAQLLFVKGSVPLLLRRLNYLRDPEFTGRADPNPLYAPVAITG
ncbi:MAG: type IV secretory system conjugative DNA transfer family protein [Gemmatimonadota bacterium]|nr:type IV secretory system conjugative DNA transfer family protein [Gemmatimonadota bacterium]